ncbi:MAG: 30S ribosomal protein S17 [Candidatus Sumerlaeota bacterium]|nr:30S ribosomal protein S17 [Candidatus Sumerlaeota bacterium]
MSEATQQPSEKKASGRGLRKVRTARVVSNKMDKSVVVAIERLVRHPRYKKYVRRTKKVMAHDAKKECGVGDVVRIVATRPLSKRKCWRVAAILRKAD